MWFNYQRFYNFIASLPDMNRMVEVGCWHGESIIHLAKKLVEVQRPAFQLWGVDIWEKWETNHADQHTLKDSYGVYNAALTKAGVRSLVTDIRKPSVEAAKMFGNGSLDFVFIDADHRPQAVLADIKAWMPKLRPNGILAGHDYYYQTIGYKWCEDDNVAEAVNEAVKQKIIPQPPAVNKNTSVWMTHV